LQLLISWRNSIWRWAVAISCCQTTESFSCMWCLEKYSSCYFLLVKSGNELCDKFIVVWAHFWACSNIWANLNRTCLTEHFLHFRLASCRLGILWICLPMMRRWYGAMMLQ
jgi:hypothetical protein